jgi:hypothetical protein
MQILIVLVLFTLCSYSTIASLDNPTELGLFSGRISKVEEKAELIRLKIDFANMKYLNKRDALEFWDERGEKKRCRAFVVGKSNSYLLIKVQSYNDCKYNVLITEGAYLKAYSQDLKNNIKMGRELVDVLLKKRLAIHSKYNRAKKEIDIHIEKVNAVNLRYEALRKKLEGEWRDDLALLEGDRVMNYKRFKTVETGLLEIDHKLEKYRIEDKNLKEDRWSLDSSLYYKK